MKASRVLIERMVTLFTLDVAHLADATAPLPRLALIVQPFAPRPDLTLADVVIDPPGFDPNALKTNQIGASFFKYSPDRNEWILFLYPTQINHGIYSDTIPARTVVYGLAHVGNAGTSLLGYENFAQPLVFGKNNEAKVLPSVTYSIPIEAFS